MTNHGKTLLMIAFEFPPSNGASVPRIESFYRYLKQWGWKVVVLTASSTAYQRIDNSYQDGKDDLVYRAMALDVHKQLSFKGKYFSFMERPDRWGLTWIPSSLILGTRLLKKYKPDVIWSSSPIPSAHHIAGKLAKKANIPWVADYRDPFHYMHGSDGPELDKVQSEIDRYTLLKADKIIFATKQVKAMYIDKYSNIISGKSYVIENGFDESNFKKLSENTSEASPFKPEKFSLYYSGVLYANGRDPVPVFDTIGQLYSEGRITAENFELVFQGAGSGTEFVETLDELGISQLVKFLEPVSFIQALSNMMACNALLLIQDERFNTQIPGKLYEYLRTQKPLLVKSPADSATSKLAEQYEGVIRFYEPDEAKAAIEKLIKLNSCNLNRELDKHNREKKALTLHELLSSLI